MSGAAGARRVARRGAAGAAGAAVLALASAGALVGQGAERGAFVVRRGSDTLAVETFSRMAGRMEAELALRTPAIRQRVAADLTPDARVSRVTLAVLPGTSGEAAPLVAESVVFRGDSALAEVHAPGMPPRQGFAPGAGALPYVNVSVAGLEQLVRRARALGGDTARIPMLVLQSGAAFTARVSRLGADSVLVSLPPGVEIRLAVDAAGRVLGGRVPSQGITMERTGEAGVRMGAAPRADYSAPPGAPYTAEEVRVPTPGGYTLAGTLTLPKGARGPVPAVVLVTGSGPQDRDSAIPPVPGYRPFRQIADTLSRRGIAVLRLDDRGTGASGGDPSRATSADFADDVRAAVAYLRGRREVAPERIAVAGHSEGGIIAPMVAASDPRIRAVVLMAGEASTGRAINLYQNRQAVDAAPGLTPAQRDSVMATVPAKVDSLAAQLPWLRFFLDYDPLPTARRVRVPTLILQGATDRQVPAEQAEQLAAAIRAGGNRDVTVRIFPELNHLFLRDPVGTADVQHYAALPSRQVPAEVLGTLADWLAAKLR